MGGQATKETKRIKKKQIETNERTARDKYVNRNGAKIIR